MMKRKTLPIGLLFFIVVSYSGASDAFGFCTPYPLCLTTPAQAAQNLLFNLPSGISNNRYVQGGYTPELRSDLSLLRDPLYPSLPTYYYLGYNPFVRWW